MRSIAFRLGTLVFGCLLIAFLAGAGVIYGVRVTDRTVDRALDAQRRLDILTEMSGRIQQYGLIAIASVDDQASASARLKEAETAVDTAISSFEPEIAKAIRAADLPLGVNAAAARARPLEQVRGGFHVLVRQVNNALAQPDSQRRGDLIRGAFNGFAALTGPYLFFLMQADRRGVEAGRDEEREMAATLTRSALASVAVALVIALVMYRLISRPILSAVAEIRGAAVAIGQGERNLRLPVRNRDELGLLAAVFNRMTARLRRGEQRVAADRSALETTVADRTADLRAANDKLSEIDSSRRRFFADVSHELRTPLTVILGECEIAMASLKRASLPPATLAASASDLALAPAPQAIERDLAAFGVIRRRAQRLQRRVEDMLRVARSESGTIELQFKRVDLRVVCASAVDAFEGATKRKDLAIRLEPAPGDDPAAGVDIAGDFEWLRQIVEGTIDNALRYAKGATLISLAVGVEGGEATLRIRDNGPGWGVADPQALLARFAKRGGSERGDVQPDGNPRGPIASAPIALAPIAPAPIANVSGHGIGLSLVGWVVDKHGGTVRLTTAPLGGAEISIRLPLA